MAKHKEKQSHSGDKVDTVPGLGLGALPAHPTRPMPQPPTCFKTCTVVLRVSRRCQFQEKGAEPVLPMVVSPVLSALTPGRHSKFYLENFLTSASLGSAVTLSSPP